MDAEIVLSDEGLRCPYCGNEPEKINVTTYGDAEPRFIYVCPETTCPVISIQPPGDGGPGDA